MVKVAIMVKNVAIIAFFVVIPVIFVAINSFFVANMLQTVAILFPAQNKLSKTLHIAGF
ncbi:hypothetical protein V7201_19995 [Bacillus sp. JJ1122]